VVLRHRVHVWWVAGKPVGCDNVLARIIAFGGARPEEQAAVQWYGSRGVNVAIGCLANLLGAASDASSNAAGDKGEVVP
jgi:hypothetical protein